VLAWRPAPPHWARELLVFGYKVTPAYGQTYINGTRKMLPMRSRSVSLVTRPTMPFVRSNQRKFPVKA
jgi:hypothetical protein